MWSMEKPAIRLIDAITEATHPLLPPEVLKIDTHTAALVIDLDGVDYILTMARVPKQRERPLEN